MSTTVSISPQGETLRPTAQPYTRARYEVDPGRTVGLGAVCAEDWSIHSTDTDALRALAAALVEAADMADAITAEHNAPVPS